MEKQEFEFKGFRMDVFVALFLEFVFWALTVCA